MQTSERIEGMTAAELIEQLQGCDPAAIVIMQSNYGDYHNTQQALPINQCDEATFDVAIRPSAYSRSGFAVVDFVDYDDAAGFAVSTDADGDFIVIDEDGDAVSPAFASREHAEEWIDEHEDEDGGDIQAIVILK